MAQRAESSGPILGIKLLSSGESIAIQFEDGIFEFHSQWLYDANVEYGPSKKAGEGYTLSSPSARICNAIVIGEGSKTTLAITWEDSPTKGESQFPALWLRAYEILVAKKHLNRDTQPLEQSNQDSEKSRTGWLSTLIVPEIQYSETCPATGKPSSEVLVKIHNMILSESAPGIVKVPGLPDPVLEDERDGNNTILTQVMKQVFGGVFQHPRRAPDTTFNVASHHEKDAKKGKDLHNTNTNEILLPHHDLTFYLYPSRVQGLYALEGESINTFVSCDAALNTMEEETSHVLPYLYSAPTAFGRVAHRYKPGLYQANVYTVVTAQPGFPDQIKRFRWHPHLQGSLVTSYAEFPKAREGHRKFQEILQRETHLLKVNFNPGDLYLWDNFRVLHGRENVLSVPRTCIGRSVPEQVIVESYRALQIERLLEFMEKWLIHVPEAQL